MGVVLLCWLGVVCLQWWRDAHDPLFIGRCTGGVWEMLCFISNTPHTHTYTCTKICDGVHSWLWTGTNLNAVFRGLLVKCNTACRVCTVVGSATHKSCHHPPTLLGKDSRPSYCPSSVCPWIMTTVNDFTVWNLGVFALGGNSIQVRPIRGPSHLPNLPPARRPRPIVHRAMHWWGLGDAMLHLKYTTHTHLHLHEDL